MPDALKRRRSRKRFQNIPSLPRDLAIEEDRATLPEVGTAIRTAADRSFPRPERHESHPSHLEGTISCEVSDRFSSECGDGVLDGEANIGVEFELSDEDGGSMKRPTPERLETNERETGEVLVAQASSREQAMPRNVVQCVITYWRALWALIMTCGSRRLTKAQYQSLRTYLEYTKRIPSGVPPSGTSVTNNSWQLPHYSTIQRSLKPLVMQLLAPRYQEYLVDIDMSKAGARFKGTGRGGAPKAAVRIVLPSEYAREDIATPDIFSSICDTSLSRAIERGEQCSYPSVSASKCIDSNPLVAARDWFYGPQQSVSVDKTDCAGPFTSFTETGDTIRVTLLNSTPLTERIGRCFGDNSCGEQFSEITGKIEHIWTVHHQSRRGCPHFRQECPSSLKERDKKIAEILNFVTYTSPTDTVSVVVPDLPAEVELPVVTEIEETSVKRRKMSPEMTRAIKERRKAMKERRREEELAWRNWKRPLVKPGDIVVLLSPQGAHLHAGEGGETLNLLSSTEKLSRVCVVFRFWAEHDERSRHVIWIPGGTYLNDDEDLRGEGGTRLSVDSICRELTAHSAKLLDVKAICLVSMHIGRRGPQKHRPVSSIGVLSTGEPYFVYRFVIYWDGFEVQSGKAATGEGVYLLCLNLPVSARSTPSAVRIISLTPPGVKGAAVLERIFSDVEEGMIHGFIDYDASGTRRRIFLDLVGVLGDTPALNAALDVLGHCGAAFCHLCRVVRSSDTLIGSRYTSQACHGFLTAFRRSHSQHLAVRDCSANAETCRLLGMKGTPTEERFVLSRLRSKLNATKGKIPLTSQGLPVVPSVFDPYRACLVAPDHLLTGHFRDCVNLALRLLPSPRLRGTCEKFMLSMLDASAMRTQNRLLDNDKKSLLSMSMTELYELSLVAEMAFEKGYAYHRSLNQVQSSMPPKCQSAIRLVGSAARRLRNVTELGKYSVLNAILAWTALLKFNSRHTHIFHKSRNCAVSTTKTMTV